ncbi:hypothetical protein BDN70DRAFT_878073 [Pholiota conissans]|uniref:F-box domain-containing protein n=1 Tax=Pholiota conissans TaxID=109636 RepID=A0A9P5Z3L2_9AGAR|nr:hypothetical protein BDN70DRAFT_878073 [Pholiota conissans]
MSFVDDLIPLILDAHHHWWPRDLAALTLVSASWLYYARKRLYAHPIIPSFPAAVLLTRSLKENPSLAPLITGISLRPTAGDASVRHQSAFAEQRAIRHLLQLEGLRSLTLGGELAVNADVFLKFILYPDELQEIHIDGSLLEERLTHCPCLEWDEVLAFAFPELRRLRLTQIDVEIMLPHPSYSSSITSLVVENVHIIYGHLSHLIQGTKALDRLHITTTDAGVMDEEIRLVLASCAVDCLHYDMRKDSNINQFFVDAPDGLVSLRCLHLDGHFVDAGVLMGVASMCRNVVELVVSGRGVRVSAEEWVHFVKSEGMNSLRRLGLPWGTNNPPFTTWPVAEVDAIRTACASRKTPLTVW